MRVGGLQEVVVEPLAPRSFVQMRVAGQGHQQRPPREGDAQLVRHLVPVHARQPEVQDQGVWPKSVLDVPPGVGCGVGGSGVQSEFLEEHGQEVRPVSVVIDHENGMRVP
jgi:hypothetical protein